MKVIAAVVVGGAAITGGRGTIAGTLAGAMLLGAIGPALTFLGVTAYWERALQGAIILTAVGYRRMARSACGRRRNRTRACEGKPMPRRERPLRRETWVLVAALAGRARPLLGHRAEFLHAGKLLRDRQAQRRTWASGDRADAGHHHWRNRFVGRLGHGLWPRSSLAPSFATGRCPLPLRSRRRSASVWPAER